MKKMKKLLAVTLSVAMIAGVFAVIEPEKAKAEVPEATSFEETFEGITNFENGTWVSDSEDNLTTWKGYVADEKFTIPSTNTTSTWLMVNDETWMTKSDYTVESTIAFDTIPSSNINVGIVARTTNADKLGYEFQLTVTKSGASKVALRGRNFGGYYVDGVSLGTEFDCTEDNVLKIEAYGTIIKCYVNDRLMITYDTERRLDTDNNSVPNTSVYTTGTAAIRVARSANTPDVGAKVEIHNFKMYEDNTFLAYNDFSEYDGNAFVISAENEQTPIKLQTEDAKGALGWNDYSVEADVTIGESGTTSTGDVYACVTGRHTDSGKNDGYEIQLRDNGKGTQVLRIYRRTNQLELDATPFEIIHGQTYNLKAVFQGNMIYAYVDDILYLTVSDATCPVGFAGIRRNGTGTKVEFDNFIVRDYNSTNLFVEDFETYELNTSGDVNQFAMRARGWNALTQWTGNCNTGTNFKVPTNRAANLALSNLIGAANWENYVVECDLDFTALDSTPTSLRRVTLSGRQNESDGGYGFRISTNRSNTIQALELVKNGEVLSSTETTTSISLGTGKRIAFGEMVTARLIVNERTVTGYIVGYESTTTCTYNIPETEEITCGYAGVSFTSVSGSNTTYEAIIDNFKVFDLDYVKEMIGDINANRIVNATDAAAMRNRLFTDNLTSDAIDVNKDGAKNIYDYVRMMRLLDSMN